MIIIDLLARFWFLPYLQPFSFFGELPSVDWPIWLITIWLFLSAPLSLSRSLLARSSLPQNLVTSDQCLKPKPFD
jgi:hypothetical protein